MPAFAKRAGKGKLNCREETIACSRRRKEVVVGVEVGMCSVGCFADLFVALFRAHPLLDEVALCDLDEKKLNQKSELPRAEAEGAPDRRLSPNLLVRRSD